MEDVLPRSSAKDAAAQWFLRLPTSGTEVTYHEDPGETHPGAAQAYGQTAPGSPPVHYQPRIGVEDAIIYLLNCVYTHLDKPGEHCEGQVL